jgi:hypothetical protein
MTRPLGFIVSGKAAAVEPLLTSSGLRDRPSSLLCPRLTPAITRGPLLASAPAVADGLELQVSLSKNVNSCCTTGPFIFRLRLAYGGTGPELNAGLRCVVPARPLRQPCMVFLFVGSSALTGGFLPTKPRDSAVASV